MVRCRPGPWKCVYNHACTTRRPSATAALAKTGSVAGLTALSFDSARPRSPAKNERWSSNAAARASRSQRRARGRMCLIAACVLAMLVILVLILKFGLKKI